MTRVSCDKTTPFEVKERFCETICEARNDVQMGIGVSAIKYERENENESFINDNVQVKTCGVTGLDIIKNECVRGSLGRNGRNGRSQGKTRENSLRRFRRDV